MVEECPHCHAKHSLHRHGFYERNAITAEKEYRLLICRFRCSICFQTVSILPHFLLPYFQHTTRTIVQWLHDVLHQTGTNPSKRQLISFYLRRFIQTISWIYMYFASVKKSFGWERDTQQQACRSGKSNNGERNGLSKSRGGICRPTLWHIVLDDKEAHLGVEVVPHTFCLDRWKRRIYHQR